MSSAYVRFSYPMIPVGTVVDDVGLHRPDSTGTSLRAEVDRYLVIQVLRYYG
jgi:hypothetical protein